MLQAPEANLAWKKPESCNGLAMRLLNFSHGKSIVLTEDLRLSCSVPEAFLVLLFRIVSLLWRRIESLCMHLCVHVETYALEHEHVHVHIHTYIHTYIHIHIGTNKQANINIFILVHM